MTKVLISIISLIIFNDCYGQEENLATKRNSIYFEAAGIAGYGSGNYERIIFGRKMLMFAVRFGIGTYHINDYTNKFNPDILIPTAINGFYGKNHKIEFGAGQTFSNIPKANLPDSRPKRNTNLHGNLTFGYRYQKSNGGLVFRIAYSPIIEYYKNLRHWAGLSFGYAF